MEIKRWFSDLVIKNIEVNEDGKEKCSYCQEWKTCGEEAVPWFPQHDDDFQEYEGQSYLITICNECHGNKYGTLSYEDRCREYELYGTVDGMTEQELEYLGRL